MTTASPSLRNSATPSPSRSEFSEKLSELRVLLAELAKAAPSAAGETFDELKGKASAFADSCEEKANSATHVVVRTIKEHPAQVALAAVGAGLLTWWLLSRRANKAD